MSEPNDSGPAFRRNATRMYGCFCVLLVAFIPTVGWAGWHFGGWIGLLLGAVVSTGLALAMFFMASFIWAMSQDGG